MPDGRRELLFPRALAVVEVVTAGAFALVGAHFFATNAADRGGEAYRAFELSVWAPDLLVAMPLLLATGIVTWRRQAVSHPLSLASGGALMFLGVLDVSFSVQFADSYPGPADRLFVLGCGIYFTVLGALLAWWARGRG